MVLLSDSVLWEALKAFKDAAQRRPGEKKEKRLIEIARSVMRPPKVQIDDDDDNDDNDDDNDIDKMT